MNEKLKTILQTAWTEPRHFFFWLGMLSACVFAVLGLTAAFGAIWPILAFVALLCLLGLMVSIPAFILAWIPPVRRLFSWVLRRRWIALVCLATLVALFYAVENWRGRRAWQTFRRERPGERFDVSSFIPAPVPKEQNFFETPLWQDMHFVQENGRTLWSDTNWGSHVIFDAFGPNGSTAPRPGHWMKQQRIDLAAWQAFYRGTNNQFPGASMGAATNYFPIASNPQSPAADVLLALSKYETNRQLLLASAARPYARFWINYDAGFGALLPHLARLKASAQYLSLQANVALKNGDTVTALQDVRLLFRLMSSIEKEPLIISQLVRIAMLQIALQPVWEGLADRQWSPDDLKAIESELGRIDSVGDYHFAMRGERAFSVWMVDYVRNAGRPGLYDLGIQEGGASAAGEFGQSLGAALFRFVPAGWFDQNKVSLCRNFEALAFPLVDTERRIVAPTVCRESELAATKLHRGLFDVFSAYLLPAFGKTAEKFARAQTSVDLARVACALERYRLANNRYPEALQVLVPNLVNRLPHDIINGQPLNYRLRNDGRFVLYSVGWDGLNSGGTIAVSSKGELRPEEGDWVWSYVEP